MLLETVPATYGFPVPPDGYLPAVQAAAAAAGALYLADEVQAGLGRTGRLWGVEHFGVEPDVLVAGKGLRGGIYPAAACVISERAAGWLHEFGWGHVSTFGGSELGCRVALAVLEHHDAPGDRRERGARDRALPRRAARSRRPSRGSWRSARAGS